MSKMKTERKETPILMKGDLVRATLAGIKTETRRIAKEIPDGTVKVWHDGAEWICENEHGGTWGGKIKCPYGQPGDLLYVRETWAPVNCGGFNDIIFKADYAENVTKQNLGIPAWKPSIFLKKEDARLWLELKEIHCERLQEITKEACVREGSDVGYLTIETIACFSYLWDSINGKRTVKGRPVDWVSNPWVWVLKYEQTDKPDF